MTNADKDAAIQKNLDVQSKTAGGTGRRVAGGLCQFSQTNEDHFGLSEVFSVDAALAVNIVNTSSL